MAYHTYNFVLTLMANHVLSSCMTFNIIMSLDTEDYIAFQLVPLTFDEGSPSGDQQCYDVAIVDDNLVEDNEIFFVTLTSPEQTLLGGDLSRATVTINPDPADGKGVCSLKAGSLSEEC